MNRLTGKMSSMEEVLDFIRETPDISRNITHWHTIPAREAEYADFPATLHPSLREVLQQRGIAQLYSHQAQTFEAAEQGRHTVTVTPTASGKTLCYNLPVLQKILENDSVASLIFIPDKSAGAGSGGRAAGDDRVYGRRILRRIRMMEIRRRQCVKRFEMPDISSSRIRICCIPRSSASYEMGKAVREFELYRHR